VTAFNLDRSARLEELLREVYGGGSEAWRALLGELQLAYLLLLLLHSHAALVFWREAVALLCNCERAIADPAHAPLFQGFVGALREQLTQLPVDLFVDELSKRSFLGPALASLRELLDDSRDVALRLAARELWVLVAGRFGLDVKAIAELDDEDGPLIVPLDDVTPSGGASTAAESAGERVDDAEGDAAANTRALMQALELSGRPESLAAVHGEDGR
jgi:A1 cistron-splicing factor AAR2